MAVCHHYRTRHSIFLKWRQDDRDKAIHQLVRERSTCRCGTRPEEWDESRGGSRRAYYAVEKHCPGCAQIQFKQDSISKPGRGSYVGLTVTPPEAR